MNTLIQGKASGLGPMPVLVDSAGRLITSPGPAGAGITSEKYRQVTTAAAGATYTPLADLDCNTVILLNNTGTSLEIQNTGDTGHSFILPDGTADIFSGITNASQLQVRRADVSNAQVTASYKAQA